MRFFGSLFYDAFSLTRLYSRGFQSSARLHHGSLFVPDNAFKPEPGSSVSIVSGYGLEDRAI
jgi:hypothetical protein